MYKGHVMAYDIYIKRKPTIMTYNPNFITKLVTTLAILPIVTTPANAKAVEALGCDVGGNIEWCVDQVDHGTYRIDVTNIHDKHTSTVVAECAKNGTRFAVAPQTHPEDGKVIAKAFCDRLLGLDNPATLAK